jgi:beta-lactamase class C
MQISQRLKGLSALICALALSFNSAAQAMDDPLKESVDKAIRPLMQEYAIPGMAIAITIQGKSYLYNYGLASKATQAAVTHQTLFEIGSVSKTLTATLATYAQTQGKLSLSEKVSQALPELRGSSFDQITLLNLATHTPGDLPLQVPEQIQTNAQLFDYLKHWQPSFAAGTHRNYSNPGIGTLGLITARRMNQPFETAIENTLLPMLCMSNTYIKVPTTRLKDYAQGYNTADEPVRVNPGVLASEAYGIKSSSADLIRFVEANLQGHKLDASVQAALRDTHTGYYQIGEMTQSLIWEQYPYPVKLETLLTGHSEAMVFKSNPAIELKPPLPAQQNVWINKTGSTNGFGAYIAYIPVKKTGIVILANKNYPISARVETAYQILGSL